MSDLQKKHDKIYPVWEIKIDCQKPLLQMIIPMEIIERDPLHELSEYLSLGCPHLETGKDSETNVQHLKLFANYILDSFENAGEIKNFITIFKNKLQALVGDELIKSVDNETNFTRFWKIIIRISGEIIDGIHPDEINEYYETDRRGSHVRIQKVNGKNFIIFKARTIDELEAIFTKKMAVLCDLIS